MRSRIDLLAFRGKKGRVGIKLSNFSVGGSVGQNVFLDEIKVR